MIPPKDLPNLLNYNKRSGTLKWKPRREELFKSGRDCRAWNTLYANKVAFTATHGAGYKHSTIWGKSYLAHRVIWALVTGSWPSGEIDHINGKRDDNRWKNLRDVSHAENLRNACLSSQNKSGHIGIFWNDANKKWRADICKDGQRHRLGEFASKKDAIAARQAAEIEWGFHPNHGRAA